MNTYLEIKPAKQLENFISCYCIIEYPSAVEGKHFRIIPSLYSQLVTYYNDDNYIDQNANNSLLPDHPLIGPLTTHHIYEAVGKVGLFSIVFKPLGVSLLLNDTLKNLSDTYVSSSHLSPYAREIRDSLIDAKSNTERLNIANEKLLKFYWGSDYSKIKIPINSMIDYIKIYKGNINISEMAHNFNCSVSKLERNFKELTSLTPKRFANITRMQTVIKTRVLNHSFLDKAISLGFYDQSHFINEFKMFTGLSPLKYFRSEDNYQKEFYRKEVMALPKPN